ncbi:MAG: tubulin-tyrosine ligase [Gammaproteobacteria bacterium]|nr:tubulin-tyrosine ligase [Gammaproteobacteria bacterium]
MLFQGLMKTFHLQAFASPAACMLHTVMQQRGWVEAVPAFFSDAALIFPEDIATTLEYKHLLAAHCQDQGFDFLPLTYHIDDNSWADVLRALPKDISKWILKPSMLNNGQDIHLFHDQADIVAHFLSPHRMGGPQVLQAYIDKPHLLKGPNSGHKYSLRLFVIACLPYGIFLYPEGYYNVSLFPYVADHRDSLQGHVTNEHVLKDRRNVIQIPSSQYQAIFGPCEEAIFSLLKTLFSSFSYPQTSTLQLGFFGMDLMLDHDEKLWLLEANHGPCFPVSSDHPLQLPLYQGFWESMLIELLEPLAAKRSPELFKLKPLYLLGK